MTARVLPTRSRAPSHTRSSLLHAGCKPEQQMMYAGSKNRLVQTAELTKVQKEPQLWRGWVTLGSGGGSQGLSPWDCGADPWI